MLDYIPNEFGKSWVASRTEWKRGVHVSMSYVDICGGNFYDAIIFSQIMYWHEPTETGESKLRKQHNGHLWLAKNHGDWYQEVRVVRSTARKALERLKARNLIVYEIHGFAGEATPHMRVNWAEFEARMRRWQSKPGKQSKTPLTPVLKEQTPALRGHTPLPSEDIPLSPEGSSNTEISDEIPSTENTQYLAPGGARRLFLQHFKARLIAALLKIEAEQTAAAAEKSKAIAAIIHAWIDEQKAIQPNAYKNKTLRDLAGAMHDQGVTSNHVCDFIKEKKKDDFWRDKFIELSKVAKEILMWMAKDGGSTPSPQRSTDANNEAASYDSGPIDPKVKAELDKVVQALGGS